MLKKLNGLSHFFDHQYRTAKSTRERISDGFEDAAKAWSVQAKREDVHYWPFTDAHIKRIFDPKPFLSNSRDPDYFWGPLLGLYLGVRLGDIVDAKVADIGCRGLRDRGDNYLDARRSAAGSRTRARLQWKSSSR
jgi:hypothetical protein